MPEELRRASEQKTPLSSPPQERGTHPSAQLIRRYIRRQRVGLRLHHGGRRSFHRFLRGFTRREPRKLLGRQLLRLGFDRFGRRTVKGDAFVIAKNRLTVRLAPFSSRQARRACTGYMPDGLCKCACLSILILTNSPSSCVTTAPQIWQLYVRSGRPPKPGVVLARCIG